jgi:hypothetical protein
LRAPSGGPKASPSGSEQEIRAGRVMLSRHSELKQYPINPTNQLHPVETSVSVARRCERQAWPARAAVPKDPGPANMI